jgi:hypothetical protein
MQKEREFKGRLFGKCVFIFGWNGFYSRSFF